MLLAQYLMAPVRPANTNAAIKNITMSNKAYSFRRGAREQTFIHPVIGEEAASATTWSGKYV